MDDDKMQRLDFEQDVKKLVQKFRMQMGPSLTKVSPRAVLQEG